MRSLQEVVTKVVESLKLGTSYEKQSLIILLRTIESRIQFREQASRFLKLPEDFDAKEEAVAILGSEELIKECRRRLPDPLSLAVIRTFSWYIGVEPELTPLNDGETFDTSTLATKLVEAALPKHLWERVCARNGGSEGLRNLAKIMSCPKFG